MREKERIFMNSHKEGDIISYKGKKWLITELGWYAEGYYIIAMPVEDRERIIHVSDIIKED